MRFFSEKKCQRKFSGYLGLIPTRWITIMRFLFPFSLSVLLMAIAPRAAEAGNGTATTSLNLRTGPGTQYPVLGTIPDGVGVQVVWCTIGYGWCRVGYTGIKGWVPSRDIALRYGGGYSSASGFGTAAAVVGIPLIAGVIIGSTLNVDTLYRRYSHRYDRPRRHPMHIFSLGDR
ncbi:SH3 domain-containing protein [Brucella pseudogrignonensis]